MSDRSTRVFGPASMPTLDNPVARASPWACKPGAGYWWQDLLQDLFLLQDDAGSVAHVRWSGTGLVDKYGNAWNMQGTVPQVQRSDVVPPGAGPFSDINHYSLGSGSDVLDFAGDFTVCVVYRLTASANNQGVVSDAAAYGATGAGWRFMDNSGNPTFDTLGAGGAFTRSSDFSIVGLNVACFGRIGATQYLKVNLRPLVSTAGALSVPAPSDSAKIGRYSEAGVGGTNVQIHEVWFSTTTPSDALFTAQMQRVKDKLGITAW